MSILISKNKGVDGMGCLQQIDIAKFVFAMCVIAIHTTPLINYNDKIVLGVYESFVRMAVPFFFITSGFFIGTKMSRQCDSNLVKVIIRDFLCKSI